MRAELGPAEMAEHTAKRAELVEQKAQLLAKSANKSEAHRPDTGQTKFDAETAKQTGKSVRSVRSDKARGVAIPPDLLAKITGTELDKGTYAKIYPKPEKGGRGKKSVKITEFGFDASYLSHARTVLRYAPDLAANVQSSRWQALAATPGPRRRRWHSRESSGRRSRHSGLSARSRVRS